MANLHAVNYCWWW